MHAVFDSDSFGYVWRRMQCLCLTMAIVFVFDDACSVCVWRWLSCLCLTMHIIFVFDEGCRVCVWLCISCLCLTMAVVFVFDEGYRVCVWRWLSCLCLTMHIIFVFDEGCRVWRCMPRVREVGAHSLFVAHGCLQSSCWPWEALLITFFVACKELGHHCRGGGEGVISEKAFHF